jgi:hypothetical protein
MSEITIYSDEYKSLLGAKFVADLLTNLLKKKLNNGEHYLNVEDVCELLGIEKENEE